MYIMVGYVVAYWQFASSQDVHQKLKQATLENQTLHTKIIEIERQLQIEQAAQTNLTKELNAVQDENMHIKQDLFFYKNMVNGKTQHK